MVDVQQQHLRRRRRVCSLRCHGRRRSAATAIAGRRRQAVAELDEGGGARGCARLVRHPPLNIEPNCSHAALEQLAAQRVDIVGSVGVPRVAVECSQRQVFVGVRACCRLWLEIFPRVCQEGGQPSWERWRRWQRRRRRSRLRGGGVPPYYVIFPTARVIYAAASLTALEALQGVSVLCLLQETLKGRSDGVVIRIQHSTDIKMINRRGRRSGAVIQILKTFVSACCVDCTHTQLF